MVAGTAQLSREPWYERFHSLMPFRVREILLVSTVYDAFILEEDGRLSERIFDQYSELNLSIAPRITHVATGAEAVERLQERRFDMVMTVARLVDTTPAELARRMKAIDPKLPVVVLAFSESERSLLFSERRPAGIDRVFLWNGDTRILLAAIKLVEDTANAAHDTREGRVRVIVVVEDSVRRYSTFLSLLYSELMRQSQSLIAEGVNELHKLLRMRARPKILLASTFEEAREVIDRYRDYLFALISDVRFPRGGVEDRCAGFALVEELRRQDPNLPVLLQSANPENEERARELGVLFINKNSPRMLRRLSTFLRESLGFGDFVFRLPDGSEVARARDMYEMEQVLQSVPPESISYHSRNQHFSVWLMARSMFRLAERLRPQTEDEFGGVEQLRQHLIEILRTARLQEQEGVVTDFSQHLPRADSHFVRLGQGSLGGKARGLAFAHAQLARAGLQERFEGLTIQTPRTVAIGTDEFDTFLEENGYAEEVQALTDDHTLLQWFLEGFLPERLVKDLQVAVRDMHGPLAVRSSSLLEDSHMQPFAGIYTTYMLPNTHPDPEVRFKQICRAVKAVYASTYLSEARAYMDKTPWSVEEERMGVVIQEVVGQRHGTRFYPGISGVARSYNYYPIRPLRADQGVVALALGLGHMVVSGGATFWFAPGSAGVQPHLSSARDFLRLSQRRFYGLDLSRPSINFFDGGLGSLGLYDVEEAEADGVLSWVGSVYDGESDTIRDSLREPGPRVVTFNNILKHRTLPLEEALQALLELFQRAIGGPIEIEFAVNLSPEGEHGGARQCPCLYVLQLRPQTGLEASPGVEIVPYQPDELLCRTDRGLGNGVIEEIEDIVYVREQGLDGRSTPAAAQQVGELNAALTSQERPYLLIGPGRWGSSDASLGVPVKWSQISGARVIVETPFHDRAVEPSQGTHFFHNLTSFRVGYLTLTSDEGMAGNGDRFIDLDWLEAQPVLHEHGHVRHIRLGAPLRVYLDGRSGQGTVLKPARPSGG